MPQAIQLSRRDFLRTGAAFTTAAALAPTLLHAQAGPADIVSNYRALGAKTPLTVTQLAPNLYLLQGIGGNMAALLGPDGTMLVDTSVQTAAPHIAESLAAVKAPPLALVINTHFHFDHTDGNAALHNAGAHDILAHENTLKRLSSPQYLEVLDLHTPAAPPAGRPTRTFADSNSLNGDGHNVFLQHFAPAHTDSDIYVWFPDADVLHVADIWFNGFYPLIDYSSGGSLPGMIAAADTALKLAKPGTKIIPGHGQLGDRGTFQGYRDMLAKVHDRIGTMKAAGKSSEEVVAAKPTADLDATWGKGLLTPDKFVAMAYKAS
ncbi:MAG TPA: MBL fold metallo-hydrolase [Acidobacteriaceae bacterium]|nr:MBL fold metallo-hydrolase [Acidobacteriaceae bacterium]